MHVCVCAWCACMHACVCVCVKLRRSEVASETIPRQPESNREVRLRMVGKRMRKV